MRLSDSMLIELLKKSGKVNEEQITALLTKQKTENKPLQELVFKDNIISEAELTQVYAKDIDVPYVELDPKAIRKEVLKLIPERIAQQYMAVVYDLRGD